MPQQQKVFINGPFDPGYEKAMAAIVFSCLFCDRIPVIADAASNSGIGRLTQIKQHIRDCDLSIHDLSRQKLTKGFPRFNMPFELGMAMMTIDETDLSHSRRILVMDEKNGRYERSVSDLKGRDIRVHGGRPQEIVQIVVNWFNEIDGIDAGNGQSVWRAFDARNAFKDFYRGAKGTAKAKHTSMGDLSWSVKTALAAKYIQDMYARTGQIVIARDQ